MKINEFTIDKINQIPNYIFPDDSEYDSVVIVPNNNIHESGWRCMHYLFCKKDDIICRAGGGSDALHLNGIGGIGDTEIGSNQNSCLISHCLMNGWVVDCTLSGFIRLHTNRAITIGGGISDFEIFVKNFDT